MSFIPSLSAITDAIANPKQVRLSQERASARSLSGLDAKMKAVRDTSPEAMPGVFGVPTRYASSNSSSRRDSQSPVIGSPSTQSQQISSLSASALRPRPQLQRSQSEMPMKLPALGPKQTFTPCITAMDLTKDQIIKNYSSDDLTVWNKSQNPLPPLGTLRGYGRYRISEFADPEWRIQHYKKQVKEIEHIPGMTANLDMHDMTGLSSEQWQILTGSAPQTASDTSSQSIRAPPSSQAQDNDTRVTRGFSPSGSSSRSSQNGSAQARKGSSLSMMNLSSAVPSPPGLISLQRASTLSGERRASGPLSTIEELRLKNMRMVETKHRIEKPCEFTQNGDPDSAIASDLEDEEGWIDIAGTNPPKVSVISQMMRGEKIKDAKPQLQTFLKRVRATSGDKDRNKESTRTIDRSKTIRATRPEVQRRQSKPQPKVPRETDASKPSVLNDQTGTCAPASKDQSPEGLELHVPNPIKQQIQLQPTKETILNKMINDGAKFDHAMRGNKDWRQARNKSIATAGRAEAVINS